METWPNIIGGKGVQKLGCKMLSALELLILVAKRREEVKRWLLSQLYFKILFCPIQTSSLAHRKRKTLPEGDSEPKPT